MLDWQAGLLERVNDVSAWWHRAPEQQRVRRDDQDAEEGEGEAVSAPPRTAFVGLRIDLDGVDARVLGAT